jgi:hypothetical protein
MMILALLAALAQDLPEFREQLIDSDVGVCYATTIADINGDGKPDIVVVTELATSSSRRSLRCRSASRRWTSTATARSS